MAVLLFASARADDIDLTSISVASIPAEWIASPVLVIGLTIAFLLVALRFLVRTRLEWPFVAADIRKLHAAALRLDSVRHRTTDLLKTFDGALLSERLSWCASELRRSSDLSNRDDVEALRTIGGKLKLFESLTDRIELIFSSIEAGKELPAGAAEREPAHWNADLRQLHQLLERMERVGRSLEQQTAVLEKTADESRGILEDAARYFSNDAGRGVEDLHTKLDQAVSALETTSKALKPIRHAAVLDRRFFSVTAPILLALALVTLSLDTIMESAAAAIAQVEEAVGRNSG